MPGLDTPTNSRDEAPPLQRELHLNCTKRKKKSWRGVLPRKKKKSKLANYFVSLLCRCEFP